MNVDGDLFPSACCNVGIKKRDKPFMCGLSLEIAVFSCWQCEQQQYCLN